MEELYPRQELSMAQVLLEEDDLGHAAKHLGGAMALGPDDGEVEQAIARLHELAGETVLELAPLAEGVFWGTAVLHAVLLVRLGRAAEGLPLLLRVQAAVPGEPLLAWANEWIEDERIVAAVDLERLLSSAMLCAESLPVPILDLLQKVAAAREPNDMMAMMCAKIARQQGRFDQAMAIAKTGHERSPSWATSTAIAGVHRAQGNLEEALHWYRDSAERGMVASRLDEGDVLLDLGRYDEAITAYDKVPAENEEHEWALSSSLFARAWANGDEEARARLAAIDSQRARQLNAHFEPYLHSLAPPDSATINMARGMDPQYAPTEVGVSSLEAPSALLVVRWVMRLAGHEDPFEITFAEIPNPDPRESLTKNPVWTYRKAGLLGRFGGLTQQARPAVSAPHKEALKEVADLAAQPYELDRWAEIAADFDATADQLRAVMVHPPDPPEDIPVWDWLFRVQVAAALALACDEDGLDPLLDGPIDWTTTAAIIALTQQAREEPKLRADALERLEPFLEEPAGPIYHHCVFLPAVRCALYLDPPEALRDKLQKLRREYDHFG